MMIVEKKGMIVEHTGSRGGVLRGKWEDKQVVP
jgi:hypothetical protein